eukprot:999345-Pyramimonas_sp.AAC.1
MDCRSAHVSFSLPLSTLGQGAGSVLYKSANAQHALMLEAGSVSCFIQARRRGWGATLVMDIFM